MDWRWLDVDVLHWRLVGDDMKVGLLAVSAVSAS
jgi:hypothetical protein